MDFKAEQKYLLMSPKKIRVVADLARKLTPVVAIETLPFTNKRAAAPLVKVIKSAIATAKAKGISETDLVFKEIQIGEGPRLKRGRPVSRGMWHPIKKRMAHIRVVLEAKTTSAKSKVQSAKLETKKEESK